MKEIERLKLNELIQLCKDSSRGFRLAAGEASDKSHQEFFRAKALERNDFARNLQNVALKIGMVPTRNQSVLGTVHRAWMNLRHVLNPHHEEIPLLECRRGEEHALKVYQDIFEEHLLPEMEPVLQEQFVSMIETRDTLRNIIAGPKEPEETDSMLRLL